MIGNDYGLYELAEEDEWMEIKKFFKLKKSDIDQIKEWWVEDRI